MVKNPPASTEDTGDRGSISGLGRFPEGGNGNPFYYSCLENPMDRGAWWATAHGIAKSQTGLKRQSLYTHTQALTPMCIGFPGGSDSKELTDNAGDLSLIPGLGRSLGEGMATHFSIFAWRIPMDRGAWWATIHGVTKNRTQLKQLSMSIACLPPTRPPCPSKSTTS